MPIMDRKTKMTILMFIILSMVILVIGGCTMMRKSKSESVQQELTDIKEDVDLNQYVDNQLQVIIQSKKYQKAGIDERKEMIEKVLIELKDEKAIRHFSYSPEDYLFSFEYSDETLGGVKIKNFNSMMN